MWRDLVDGLPQGEPESGDRGLDHTGTWGRIYWGGALFCMVADLQIRERTGNRHSLDDAVRAIVAAGGTLEHTWTLSRAFAVGDAAVGVPVLSELYAKMGDAAVTVDLDGWWRRLGIENSSAAGSSSTTRRRWPACGAPLPPRPGAVIKSARGCGMRWLLGTVLLTAGCFGSGDSDLSPIEVALVAGSSIGHSASMAAAAMDAPVACVQVTQPCSASFPCSGVAG